MSVQHHYHQHKKMHIYNNLVEVRKCGNNFGYTLKNCNAISPRGLAGRLATVYGLQQAIELRLQIRHRQHTDGSHFLSRVFRLQKGLQLYMSLHYICPGMEERHKNTCTES
jgi:hypothetical protein